MGYISHYDTEVYYIIRAGSEIAQLIVGDNWRSAAKAARRIYRRPNRPKAFAFAILDPAPNGSRWRGGRRGYGDLRVLRVPQIRVFTRASGTLRDWARKPLLKCARMSPVWRDQVRRALGRPF